MPTVPGFVRRRVLVPLLFASALGAALFRPDAVSAGGQQAKDARGGQNTQGLKIPAARPRLWWTPARIAQARAWSGAGSVTPRRNDNLRLAFRYVVNGDTAAARAAIDNAMRLTFSTSRVASNEARWYGEQVILTYDWCYDRMTPAERATLVERWNGYLDDLRKKQWGGPQMPQNNYFWGYLRNELDWAIATWGENPMAESFLEHALKTRWEGSFLPHAAGAGVGGVAQEGTQYGRYLLGYPVVPFISAGLMGRQPFNETPFFRSAVYALLYATTPAPTAGRAGKAQYELFPFGDDQFFQHGGSAVVQDYGDFMSAAASLWGDMPAGQYAGQWLKLTGAPRGPHVQALEKELPARDFSSLPLDYFAPGGGMFYGRTAWGPGATLVHLQLGELKTLSGHEHGDLGNWQMWRKGRWLSRETTGYTGTRIAGPGGAGIADVSQGPAHNVVLFNGKGLAEQRNGPPVIKRLESRAEYAYAAVELTPVYRNDQVRFRRPERDNAAVRSVEREFVFIRPLETLVVFDRLQSNSADGVTKTFLAHFEQSPAPQGRNSHAAKLGDQALRVTTLVPASPSSRVVAEGGNIGQFRLEVETRGEALSYFLHVLEGGDAGAPGLDAQVAETAQEFQVTLRHPARGGARLVFRKGAATSGGGIGFSAQGVPSAVSPFIDRAQRFEVTDQGPRWEGAAAPAPAPAGRKRGE